MRAIECPKCKDIIYSRTRHDMHHCSCGEVSVDGGFDYLRITFDGGKLKVINMPLPTSKKELYNDWNLKVNKFGIIKPNETRRP